MRPARALLPLLFVVVMIALATSTAKADCVEYWDNGSVNCTGTGGCESQWENITCFYLGCVSGTCNPKGNSTECCGVRHDYAQIYSDGGGNCSGIECDDTRFRVHARSLHTNPQYRAELLRGYTPGLIMLSADRSYKETELVYVFNRCDHSYDFVVYDGRVIATGGM